MAQPRILLVEDHPLMQRAVCAILHRQYAEIEIADRTDQVFAALDRADFDAVVLDVSLPGRSGLAFLPELRLRFPELAVITLTSHAEPAYRTEAIRRGADIVVMKWAAGSQLLPAISAALTARKSAARSPRLSRA